MTEIDPNETSEARMRAINTALSHPEVAEVLRPKVDAAVWEFDYE